MKIVLLGYMGSGKSTVGKNMAKALNYEFIDLDEYISEQVDMSITTIFETKGELFFRKKEHQFLQEILQSEKDIVLSLGGGTPCYYNNFEYYYNKSGIASFYLKASIATLFDRLVAEKSTRPLLKTFNEEELKEFIAKHLFERNEFYLKSDKTIDVNAKSVALISDEILAQLA